MRRFALVLALVASLGAMPTVTLANIGPQTSHRLTTSGSFTAPVGFQIFCLTNRAHCRGGGAGEIRLTEAAVAALSSVNSQVNRSIRARPESTDTWSLGVSSGDCEDYVLAKRAMLIGMGFPPGALRIALATTRGGVGHAVLIVRTSEGDLVLDNLTRDILPTDRTSLRWVAMTTSNGRSFQRVV